MAFTITQGKIQKAKKVCIYGPEGVGKSSFASHFPNVLFIDTEGSTDGLDVRRAPKPSSWIMLMDEIAYILAERPCKTLVIDTIDWAEQLCIEFILGKYDKNGIEDFGYGNGYVYEKEEFGRLLNQLQKLIDAGINVVLTAHAQTRKFSQPDEIGEYDRYELKLGKKTGSQISPLIKEWCDLLLFANFKTVAVAVDKEGKRFKAQGGTSRVMYTSHHACYDAKNRNGLPPEMPFDYAGIAHLFPDDTPDTPMTAAPENVVSPSNDEMPFTMTEQSPTDTAAIGANVPYEKPQSDAMKKLTDLMNANEVTEKQVQKVVALRGYFPETMPISDYPDDFVEGCLIGAWDKVFALVNQNRNNFTDFTDRKDN